MPKKKTGARKKADKMRLRQKEIRAGGGEQHKSIVDLPCNIVMVDCSVPSVFEQIRNATNARSCRRHGHFAISAWRCNDYPCAPSAASRSVCQRRAIVWSNTAWRTPPACKWWWV
jgi:hypothetical protein